MTTSIPSIACLGVIGRNNNPLHISIFPSYDPSTNTFAPVRTPLQFSLLLSSSIDVFELRARENATAGTGLSGDLGLLHAVDDRLAAYGYETNTGVRMVCVVDVRGRSVNSGGGGGAAAAGGGGGGAAAAGGALGLGAGSVAAGGGLRDGELKPVFRAMQNAWVRLSQNPFFEPDVCTPLEGSGGARVRSKRFEMDMKRIGEGWTPGVTSL